MECPSVMKSIGKDDFLILEKYAHGVVQEVRQYNEKVLEILKKVDFTRGNDEPLHKKEYEGYL